MKIRERSPSDSVDLVLVKQLVVFVLYIASGIREQFAVFFVHRVVWKILLFLREHALQVNHVLELTEDSFEK